MRHWLFHRRGNWWPYGWGCERCDAERLHHLATSPAVRRAMESMRQLGLNPDLALHKAMETAREERPR